MATHSSNLAWKIPWTEKPGRLQSMGLTKSQTRVSDFTVNLVGWDEAGDGREVQKGGDSC